MTKDINYRSAVEIMGWHIEHRSGLWTVTECHEGECNVWVDEKGNVQAKAEDDSYVGASYWDPIRDLNQCFQVVERLTKLGWDFRLAEMEGANVYAEFSHYPSTNGAHYARAKIRNGAILRAALAALASKGEEK